MCSLGELVFEYAERNGIGDGLNKERKTLGKDWAISFCKRQNLSIGLPEKRSFGRIMRFNETQVFFGFLPLEDGTNTLSRKVLRNHHHSPTTAQFSYVLITYVLYSKSTSLPPKQNVQRELNLHHIGPSKLPKVTARPCPPITRNW